MSHVWEIGQQLKTDIESLLQDVQGDGANSSYDTVSRASQIPYVAFRKRRAGRGREDDLMRIDEGITIVPMKPVRSMGTNECDGVGYRYLIAIVSGTQYDEMEAEWQIPIWEQAIRRQFHNKRISGMTLTNACQLRTHVEPGDLPKWAALEEGMEASFLVLTEYVRESRRT